MKVMAFNGSPRKTWNTATLLQKALEGAASKGAQTKLVHLYDLKYTGCKSCFACKTKDGPSYGRCAAQDELTPILKEVAEADALILGSPIYFGGVTGEMKSFMERLLFPYLRYSLPSEPESLFPRKIQTGLIYTMNVTEQVMNDRGYQTPISLNEGFLRRLFGSAETLCCFDTYQFDDYSKMVVGRFDPVKKLARRQQVFPQDCERAFAMGARLAGTAVC
jgi:multimeric flavodoxin WrbA